MNKNTNPKGWEIHARSKTHPGLKIQAGLKIDPELSRDIVNYLLRKRKMSEKEVAELIGVPHDFISKVIEKRANFATSSYLKFQCNPGEHLSVMALSPGKAGIVFYEPLDPINGQDLFVAILDSFPEDIFAREKKARDFVESIKRKAEG